MPRKRKQHVYEVTLRQHHDAVVLIAADNPKHALELAETRLSEAEETVTFEFAGYAPHDEWSVVDKGEDEGQ